MWFGGKCVNTSRGNMNKCLCTLERILTDQRNASVQVSLRDTHVLSRITYKSMTWWEITSRNMGHWGTSALLTKATFLSSALAMYEFLKRGESMGACPALWQKANDHHPVVLSFCQLQLPRAQQDNGHVVPGGEHSAAGDRNPSYRMSVACQLHSWSSIGFDDKLVLQREAFGCGARGGPW